MNKIFLTVIFILSISAIGLNAQTDSPKNLPEEQNKLFQNYPDPFNDLTRIEFTLEDDSFVKIYLTNKLGKVIQTLVDGEVEKGNHKIHFRNPIKGETGIFVCKMEVYLADTDEVLFSDQKIVHIENYNRIVYKK